jgi:5-methylcytosine-specific restriction endonuclease McrA
VIVCLKCKVAKPVEAFKANELRPRHGSKWCRECSNAYQRSWKEARRRAKGVPVKVVKYLAMRLPGGLYQCRRCGTGKPGGEFSPSNLKPRGRGWCRECVTDHCRRGKPYEILLAASARYRATGKAKLVHERWRKTDKGRAATNEYARSRRAQVREKIPVEFYDELNAKQKGKCAVCRDTLAARHVDHIIPLARGGFHERSNLQLLCQPCNSRKSAKDPIRFMQERGFLL